MNKAKYSSDDFRETTITYVHYRPEIEVEIFTALDSVKDSLCKRNSNYTRIVHLNPGWLIYYSLDQVRKPTQWIKSDGEPPEEIELDPEVKEANRIRMAALRERRGQTKTSL